jgi:hypothetical protein
MDYDRIRERYDESRPVMSVLTALAKDGSTTIPLLLSNLRKAMKLQLGMDDKAAETAISLEDREIAVKEKEPSSQEKEQQASRRSETIKADAAAFAAKYPRLDYKSIPPEVWAEVNRGQSLLESYEHFTAQQELRVKDDKIAALQSELDAKAKAAENTASTTGSMQSAGDDTSAADAFMEGFGD